MIQKKTEMGYSSTDISLLLICVCTCNWCTHFEVTYEVQQSVQKA